MTDLALNSPVAGAAPADPALRPNLDKGFNPLTMILFCGILAAGLLYGAYSIYVDIDATGMPVTAAVCLSASLYVLFPNLFGVSAVR